MNVHPYRTSEEPPPRFVCVSCYRTASVNEAGTCSKCGAPRVPLESDQVREDVRAHAEKVQQKALGRRVTFSLVSFSLLAVLICVLLWLAGWLHLHPAQHAWRRVFDEDPILFGIWAACVLGGGALLELIARRRGKVDTDPSRLKLPEVLQFLRVSIEG